jgi:hypothetical protein
MQAKNLDKLAILRDATCQMLAGDGQDAVLEQQTSLTRVSDCYICSQENALFSCVPGHGDHHRLSLYFHQ